MTHKTAASAALQNFAASQPHSCSVCQTVCDKEAVQMVLHTCEHMAAVAFTTNWEGALPATQSMPSGW